SNENGEFLFANVPYGSYRLIVHAKNLGQVTQEHIIVEGDVKLTVRYAVTSSGGLHIIASVSATNTRQVSVQPVSVTTITPQTFADQGEQTWRHVRSEIPGVNVGMATGYTQGTISIPDSPLMAQILQIGGALPYESTATLDNMPLSSCTTSCAWGSSAFVGQGVDLSDYDPNAFGHSTVTIGPGADSPSILNAVGGTLNLSPASAADHNSANFSVGTDPYGGILANADAAFHTGRLS